jgi:hypothetical protein
MESEIRKKMYFRGEFLSKKFTKNNYYIIMNEDPYPSCRKKETKVITLL